MRLAITRSGFYSADRYCADARAAKKILRENTISLLAIGYELVGRGNGCEILDWAFRNALLPSHVVLLECDRVRRTQLAIVLQKHGYRSGDQTTYIKSSPNRVR